MSITFVLAELPGFAGDKKSTTAGGYDSTNYTVKFCQAMPMATSGPKNHVQLLVSQSMKEPFDVDHVTRYNWKKTCIALLTIVHTTVLSYVTYVKCPHRILRKSMPQQYGTHTRKNMLLL